MNFKKAFTLLELLVVIGIIAVIVSLGFASYSTAQKKVRDTKRKSDLKEIQNALEQYYVICGYEYPTIGTADSTCTNGTVPLSISCSSPSQIIMSSVPKDPKSGESYCYFLTGDGYSLSTRENLETEPIGYTLVNRQ
jgi:prepilin-type N-terminal cleavage/methylation domain-containing protein